MLFSPRRAELYEKVEASSVTLQQAQGQTKPITDNCVARVGSIDEHRFSNLKLGRELDSTCRIQGVGLRACVP